MSASSSTSAPLRPAVLALALVVACGWPSPTLGQSGAGRSPTQITAYDVRIRVGSDGRLFVTEDITLRGLGRAPEWDGLHRAFSPDRDSPYTIPFSEMQVRYDGREHRWWSPVLSSDRRVTGIRIHPPESLPPPGIHHFKLEYVTHPRVARGPDGDHLEWSVTGAEWGFPILATTAEVLPAGRGDDDLCGPDGLMRPKQGSIRWRVSGAWRGESRCTISVGRLEAGQAVDVSLTLAMGVVRDPVAPPRAVVDLVTYLEWAPYMDGELILALVLSVFALLWLRVGRGPPEGTLVPQYGPPDDRSPAVLGYLRAGEYTDACLTAALINLAVKGVIRIEARGGRWHLVTMGRNEEAASVEERWALRWILGSEQEVALPRPEDVGRAAQSMRTFLEEELRPAFTRNRRWFAIGLLVSVAAFAFLAWRVRSTLSLQGLPLGAAWVAGNAILVPKLLDLARRWRHVLALKKVRRLRSLAVPTLALTPFFLLLGMLGLSLRERIAGHLIVAALALVVLNVLFHQWLAAPNAGGRLLLDRVQGFRHFLVSTAGDRLNRLVHPESTLEELDPLLPYAVALDVSVRWAEGFSDALHRAPVQGAEPTAVS